MSKARDLLEGGWIIVLPVVVVVLIILSSLTVNAVIVTNIYEDFDDQSISDINATLAGNAQIVNVSSTDYVLRLYPAGVQNTGGAIEVPVDLDTNNVSISFDIIFGTGDGVYVYILNGSVSSIINNNPSDSYEDKVIGLGYGIGFDVYGKTIRIMHNDGSGSVQDTTISYQFNGTVEVPVRITILNGNITIEINGTKVLDNYQLSQIGDTKFNYLVIGARTGLAVSSVDVYIDDLSIISDDGTTPATTTTPTNTATSTTTTTTNTTTTTGLTEKIEDWWNDLSTIQKVAVVIGGLIFLMIIVYALSPSKRVR